jgi:hypothetical protein
MLMMQERRLAIWKLRGCAISELLEAGAIREYEEHDRMQDRAIARQVPPSARTRRLPRYSPSFTPLSFLGSESVLGPARNHRALFVSERDIQVQHERISINTQLCHDKRRLVHHQPADEVDVTGKSIQFRDNDRCCLNFVDLTDSPVWETMIVRRALLPFLGAISCQCANYPGNQTSADHHRFLP